MISRNNLIYIVVSALSIVLIVKGIFIEGDVETEVLLFTAILISIYLVTVLFVKTRMIAVILFLSGVTLEIFSPGNIGFLALIIANTPFTIESIREKTIIRYFLIFVIALAILIISGALRIGTTDNFLAFSIYDDINPSYVPFLFTGGLVLVLGRIVLTISPLSLIVVGVVSFFASDNTYRIISKARTSGIAGFASLASTAIACQCENTIGFSAITITIASILAYPLIILSAALLVLTNLYLRGHLSINNINSSGNRTYIYLMISVLALVIVDVASMSPLIIVIVSSFISGIILLYLPSILGLKWGLQYFSFIWGLLLQMLSFYILFSVSINNSMWLVMYEASSTSGSLLLGMSFHENPRARVIVREIFFSMWAMVSIISVLYVSSTRTNYDPLLTVTTVLFFLLFASIPLMWYENVNNLKLLSPRNL